MKRIEHKQSLSSVEVIFLVVFLFGVLCAFLWNFTSEFTFAQLSPEQECFSAGDEWRVFSLTTMREKFSARWDILPKDRILHGMMGFSSGEGRNFEDYAFLVNLNQDGIILARNGERYDSENRVSYLPGVVYHFRAIIDVPTKTYDLFVSEDIGEEVQIADDYDFRDNALSDKIDSAGIWASFGKFDLCLLEITPLSSNILVPTKSITQDPLREEKREAFSSLLGWVVLVLVIIFLIISYFVFYQQKQLARFYGVKKNK